MKYKVEIPKFATEREEAEWIQKNRARFEKEMLAALKDGTARQGLAARILSQSAKSVAKNITINMRLEDLARARRIADKKGIGYQTYVKMLLREGLDREEAVAGPQRRVKRSA